MLCDAAQKRSIGYRLREALEAELRPGEHLLWIGRPNPARLAFSSVGASLFGIPWTVLWLWGLSGYFAAVPWPWWPAAVFYLLPLWFGYLAAPAPFWSWRDARRTVYALSDRRVLVVRLGRTRTVGTYAPDSITDVERRERRDGSGDLILTRGYRDNISLSAIPEVQWVERLVRETFLDRREAAPGAKVPALATPPPDTVTASRAPWWTNGG